MPTKRRRKDNWEFVVRRKHLLPRPLYFTFDTEEEGDKYCQRLEALLDQGVIPDEILERAGQRPERPSNLSDAIDIYLQEHKVGDSDEPLLLLLSKRIGHDALWSVDDLWAKKWIESLKRERKLAPGTIRHQVGALSRCLDWVARNKPHLLAVNPLRSLPRGYSSYSPKDIDFAGVERSDAARDRRLSADEDSRIRSVLAGTKRDDRQRPLALRHRSALRCLYVLALESAMRLREMYTLEAGQVDFERRTVFLDATKNGSKRQVPLTSIAASALNEYFDEIALPMNRARTKGRGTDRLFVFPWFDGDYSQNNLMKITSLLSRQFARIFETAACEDLRFHDLRHEATSRLYERTALTDLQIAKITGHKTLGMLARYANLRGSDLAEKLW